jgi:hypothetical protein
LLALGTSLDIDAQRRDAVTTPESLLLKRIDEELINISEAQHVQARQAAVLKKARTLLHVGCSTIEVNAMLAEHLRKERAQGTSSARTSHDTRKDSSAGVPRYHSPDLFRRRSSEHGSTTEAIDFPTLAGSDFSSRPTPRQSSPAHKEVLPCLDSDDASHPMIATATSSCGGC